MPKIRIELDCYGGPLDGSTRIVSIEPLQGRCVSWKYGRGRYVTRDPYEGPGVLKAYWEIGDQPETVDIA